MNQFKKICICGGGNIAHSLVAAFARHFEVSVLTRRPQMWSDRIRYQTGDAQPQETAHRVWATAAPSSVSDAELIVIALPRFAIEDEVKNILPYLHKGQALSFIPAPAGIDEIIKDTNDRGVEIVAFQRVPFISRIVEYGKSVRMGDVRPLHRLAITNPERRFFWRDFIECSLGGRVEFLSSFLSFTFSNSNPLLHPARLIELLEGGNGGVYRECPLFYAEWGDMASELYIKADKEMAEVFHAYSPIAAKNDYESVLKHYGVASAKEMTQKIRSIPSFKTIVAPWKCDVNGVWCPDYSSRYFTEDIPFGTKVIKKYADKLGLLTPTIDFMIKKCSACVI